MDIAGSLDVDSKIGDADFTDVGVDESYLKAKKLSGTSTATSSVYVNMGGAGRGFGAALGWAVADFVVTSSWTSS